MAARWSAVFVMLAAIGMAGAEDSGKTIQQEMAEQLDLFSLCSPGERMDVVVDDLPAHAAGAGLTANAIREAVEGRLRRARLLDPNAEPLLHVEIVLGEPDGEHIPFYSVEVRYLRDLVAERLRLAALAETWSTGGAGQGDAASFLDHVGSYVDAFIAEYRRVRDSEACVEAGKPRPPEPDSQPGG